MDRHLLFELAYMLHRIYTSVIHDERGLMERPGSFAFSIPRVKGDLEIRLRDFFMTLVPTPLPDGLLRLLLRECSSSQEYDSLGGVSEHFL